MNPIPLRRILVLFALPMLLAVQGRAQWQTQEFALKSGWNAVYLHVDPSQSTLDSLVGSVPSNLIREVWMWAPPAETAQFVKDPETPTPSNKWLSWTRDNPAANSLTRLRGNAAFLVRATGNFTWTLKGRPLGPSYFWSGDGLNLVGFPTQIGAATPTFEAFLSPAGTLQNARIFRYPGGPISSTEPKNPDEIADITAAKANRGEAFWVRSSEFNRYFGPVAVDLGSETGIDFGSKARQFSLRLRNQTKSPLTVTVELRASEAPPAGQPAIPTAPPLLVRGEVNRASFPSLTHAYTRLPVASSLTRTLQAAGTPGSESELILGLDRGALNIKTNELAAGILRVTDSLGLSRIDLPVSASMGSDSGLWVGTAAVDTVNQYLTTYYTAESDAAMKALLTERGFLPAPPGVTFGRDPINKTVIRFANDNGSYLAKGTNTESAGVAKPFSFRLIVHNDPAKSGATLLQRAYLGPDTAGNLVVATREGALDKAQLAAARRISTSNLPWKATPEWAFDGLLSRSASIAVSVDLPYGDTASNPFLHQYHPDHDNLDRLFEKPEVIGVESYGINRRIRLVAAPAEDNFETKTAAGIQISGKYLETMTLVGKTNYNRSFVVGGSFLLNRIAETPTLTP